MTADKEPSDDAPPEVSVVMGVFNDATHLEATVASVLSQAGCRLEFIVVDDGSTDGTGQLLDDLAAADSRLRVVHQPNAGLTRALVAGCAAARASFIARQDSADLSLPGRLRRQLEAFRQDAELVFVSCGTEYVEPGGAFLYRSGGTGRAPTPSDVVDLGEKYGVSDGPSHHGSVMFRRDAYLNAGGYRPEFYFGQDWDLWFRLAQLGKFQMLPETLYRAALGVGDISTSNKPLQEELAQLSLQAFRLRMEGKPDADVLAQAALIRPQGRRGGRRRRAAGGSYFIGECLRRNGNHSRARDYFLEALKSEPWHLKAWARLVQIAFEPAHREQSD